MKKLVTLFAAAGMVMAASAPASAVDTKVDVRHRISFQSGSEGFAGQNVENFTQRMRLGLTFAASENLKGYIQFQIMGGQMGSAKSNAGDADVKTRQMYIDWTVPATPVKVRMGRMEMGLPADAFGENGVMASGFGSRDGIVVTAPVTDWLSLTALWNRAGYKNDLSEKHDLDNNKSDDVYAAVANLKFNGVSGSVYAAYATVDGADAGTRGTDKWSGSTLPTVEGDAYWIGFTSTFSYFDPFTLKLSAAYGSFEARNDFESANDQDGWNVQAKASYKTSFGTPVLGAWYFSGDDKDEKGHGYMPSVQGAFTPLRAYNDASKGLNGGLGYENPQGWWGVQAGIEKVSFLQGLTHDFLVSYVAGTNDVDPNDTMKADYLTTDDAFVCFDLSSTYKIYKNLSMHLDLSYMINDFDAARKMDKDDYNAELTFEYRF